jgi:hypothetical protein
MNLNEEISRIKQVMGIISEGNITLPLTVSGSFKGDNGDKSHAFQSTGGVVVGGMQTKVNAKLKEVYDSGYNPDITKIKITIDKETKTTSWDVTIDESADGKAYVGLVTVGSCCNSSFKTRADGQVKTMKTWNSTPENHKLAAEIVTTDDGSSNGDITIKGGNYKLKQLFYVYSKDSKKPHPKKTVEKPKESVEKPLNLKIDKKYAAPADATRVQINYPKFKF